MYSRTAELAFIKSSTGSRDQLEYHRNQKHHLIY